MSLFLDDPDFRLYVGDVREQLAHLEPGSVDCVITSPPYWGLRDYGAVGQIGLEPTPEAYVAQMVEVFRGVWRVLADHGTCWVNLGDSYSGGGGYAPDAPVNVARREQGSGVDGKFRFSPRVHDRQMVKPKVETGLKPKDLVGIPWRVAFALQADGWYLRSDIVWAKPNPMPESVTDRPTKSHEYIFLLSKRPRYFFDQEAVRERYGDPEREWWNEARTSPGNPDRNDGGGVQGRPPRGPDGRRITAVKGADGSIQHRDGERWPNGGRNVRSVWEIATQPYPEAHFATYPEELVRRCLLAGCPEGGTVLDPFCGSGTTALVARKHGRKCVGIELSPVYAELCARRLSQLSLLAEAAG